MRTRYPQLEALQRCDRAVQPCAMQGLGGTNPAKPVLEKRIIEAALAAGANQPIAVVADPEQRRFVLAQATGSAVFSLWVDGRRFANTSEFTQPDSAFELMLTKQGISLFRLPPQREAGGLETALLPRLSVEKALGSASQPFWLRVERQVRFSELPILAMLAFLAGGALLTLLLLRFFFAVREARRERLEAQLALQRERARAEGTVRAVSDALITCDRDGVITLVNPAAGELIGSEDALLGKLLHQAVQLQATLSQQPLTDFLGNFWRTPQATELPEGSTLVDQIGRMRLVEGTLSPLSDEQGQLAGAVLALRDLGPFRKRMLEALEASERRLREHEAMLAHVGRVGTLSEIAAGIAHELNQPLTAILSQNQASLRLLEEEEPDLNRVQRSLKSSAEQARRAGQILERLRAHVARQPLRRDAVDLRQVVENVRVLTEHELRERGIVLLSDLGKEPLEVEGDAIQLEQVLHNLLRNAIEALSEASPEQRRIRLEAGRAGSSLWLEVRDFGPGIAPEILPHLFTPFVIGKQGGLGLGLSLSQTLVQGMGGHLRGENASEGGARFVLSLPALRRERVGHFKG
jgi:PAS domain S-box-containing protein